MGHMMFHYHLSPDDVMYIPSTDKGETEGEIIGFLKIASTIWLEWEQVGGNGFFIEAATALDQAPAIVIV